MTKGSLLVTVAPAVLMLGAASPAWSQATNPSPTAPNGAAASDQAGDIASPAEGATGTTQDVVVTGSRIARPETDFPNPITSVTAASIQQSGFTNLTDLLIQTPALIGSSTSQDNSGSTAGFGTVGVNLLNLRNLGTDRTLVLVNGRRHVAGLPDTAAVDINSIPLDLIERVDVLTGGTSAVYGADGVSGVVNFVLRRNFDGVSARAQSGISEQGDGRNLFGSLTVGRNFAGDRGNIAVNYEFNDDQRVNTFARSRTGDPRRAIGIVRNPDDFPDTLAVPDRIPINDLRYADSARNGAVSVDFDTGIPTFTGDGQPYDRGRLLPGSGGLTQGGDSTPLAGYQGDIQPANRRHVVNALASFEFSPAFRLFAEGKYANTRAYSIAQPTYLFYTYITPENPFVPAAIAPFAPDGSLLSRDNFDLGIRGEQTTRETLRGVIGADGRITEHATYELSYNYGQTTSTVRTTGNIFQDRFYAALDAIRAPDGQIVCRSTLDPTGNIDPNNYDQPAQSFTPGAGSGCAPLNLFGENQASAASLAFINANLRSRSRVTQQVVSGSISGDFGQLFRLPGGAVGFAIGGEYRRETSRFQPDANLIANNIFQYEQVLPSRGRFDVKEAFAELNVPLLKNMRFADTLAFGAAIRLSDYSTVGRTTTWSVNGVYAPVSDISFRGTYSQAVRAPNIGELFSPAQGISSFINDPCDPQNINAGTQYRVANCQAALAAAGLSPAQIAAFNPQSDPQATQSLPGRSAGNVNLAEETAKTWTAGVVLRPRFVPGFTLSFDWYDIRIRGAINTPTAQELVELCVDQPTLQNQYCANVGRDPATGYVNNYLVTPANVAAFRTAGADAVLNYRFQPGNLGTFNLRVVGGYLNRLTFVPTIGADVDSDLREQFAPRFSATADLTWTNGPVTINYGINWFDKTRRYTTEQLAANPDLSDPRYFFYKEKWEHELQVSFNANDRFTFYGGANNLFNQQPDIGSANYPISPLGRFIYFGVRLRLANGR